VTTATVCCRLERGVSAMCAVLGINGLQLSLQDDDVSYTIADIIRAVGDIACSSEAARIAACRYILVLLSLYTTPC
jgi:hypothetical protein